PPRARRGRGHAGWRRWPRAAAAAGASRRAPRRAAARSRRTPGTRRAPSPPPLVAGRLDRLPRRTRVRPARARELARGLAGRTRRLAGDRGPGGGRGGGQEGGGEGVAGGGG